MRPDIQQNLVTCIVVMSFEVLPNAVIPKRAFYKLIHFVLPINKHISALAYTYKVMHYVVKKYNNKTCHWLQTELFSIKVIHKKQTQYCSLVHPNVPIRHRRILYWCKMFHWWSEKYQLRCGEFDVTRRYQATSTLLLRGWVTSRCSVTYVNAA